LSSGALLSYRNVRATASDGSYLEREVAAITPGEMISYEIFVPKSFVLFNPLS
jgi:hypothetical protein